MSDVKDILGFERTGPSTNKGLDDLLTPRKRVKKDRQKKPEGVSREVFNLIQGQQQPGQPFSAEDLPSLVPRTTTPDKATPGGLKEKRKLIRQVRHWEWKPFKSSARNDGAVFYHWQKDEEDYDDNPFAKFNKKVILLEYTDEQYNKYFNKDENWTKEETDLLWKLCKDYDLRFIVIADRFPGDKSIEDLKDRYYMISKKLVELNAEDEDISKHPLYKYTYNKAHEVERKIQYEKFYNRTKEQVEEEQKLMQEYKRIESNLKKHNKEKKKSKVEEQPKSGRKRKKSLTNVSAIESTFMDDETASPLHDLSTSVTVKGIRKEKASGTFTRSSTILSPLVVSNKTSKRVDEILVELGVGIRPMPTASVAKAFNELRQEIATLIDLQKHVSQKEYQLQILRDQKK